MFHSNRPLMCETYQGTANTAKASKAGSFTLLGGTDGDGISIIDTAALYGAGSDGPGQFARFRSSGAVAPGSAGVAGELGGWQLMFASMPFGTFSGTANTYGVMWSFAADLNATASTLTDIGCMQPGSMVYNSCGFAVDLIQRLPSAPSQVYAPGVFLVDPNSANNTISVNTASTTGATPRFSEIWMAVCNGNGATASTIPAPISSVGTATTLSAATLNTSIAGTFTLLNNPPLLNVQVQSTGAITANTITLVPFTSTPLVDNYSGYNVPAGQYTVPLTGNYLLHANVIYATNWNVGQGVVGFSVASSIYWGGSYNATSPGAQNTGISVTKVLDLHAGDVVRVVTETSTTSQFGNANVSHFIMSWLTPINTSTQSWVAPDVTGFQFAAGNPPGVTAAGPSTSGSAGSPSTFQILATLTIPAGPTTVNWTATLTGTVGSGDANNFAVRVQSGPMLAQSVNAGAVGVYPQAPFSITGPIVLQLETWSSTPTAGSTYAGSMSAANPPGQTGLVSLLNTKLANDVNFLLNRPYCTVHQTSTQTGLSVGAWHSVTMQSTVGLVHGGVGDNYAGWSTSGNHYAAPVNGWYLAVAEYNAATITTTNSYNSMIAGFSVPTSGGVVSPTSGNGPPDWFQHMLVANGWTYPTGVTAMNVYYLLAGETITPVAQYQSGTATTWATDVSHGFDSHLSIVWLSN
jgi:hypothetical protein